MTEEKIREIMLEVLTPFVEEMRRGFAEVNRKVDAVYEEVAVLKEDMTVVKEAIANFPVTASTKEDVAEVREIALTALDEVNDLRHKHYRFSRTQKQHHHEIGYLLEYAQAL